MLGRAYRSSERTEACRERASSMGVLLEVADVQGEHLVRPGGEEFDRHAPQNGRAVRSVTQAAALQLVFVPIGLSLVS
jgi:hypothetical protein